MHILQFDHYKPARALLRADRRFKRILDWIDAVWKRATMPWFMSHVTTEPLMRSEFQCLPGQ
jgi:hypothetical protein